MRTLREIKKALKKSRELTKQLELELTNVRKTISKEEA